MALVNPNNETLASVPRSTLVTDIVDLVERDGGVIIEGLLSATQVAGLNEDLDAPLAALAPGAKKSFENSGLEGFHGANTKRMTNLLAISPTFRRVIQDEVILGISDAMMLPYGDAYWMNTASVIEIGPHNKEQPLHRDMENYPIFRSLGPAGPNVMCNFLIALTPFNEQNGATRVIPGSNLWPDFDELDRRAYESTIPAVMDPGDALLIGGKIVHGGGRNHTSDGYRRGLALAFNPGCMVPEEAYPFLVPLDVVRSLPPRIQQLIGFRSFHNLTCGGGSLWQAHHQDLADHLQLGPAPDATNRGTTGSG